MKRILFTFAIIATLNGNAQTHLITFAASGESTSVSSVEVENLTTGTSLTINGTDILRLTSTVDIKDATLKETPRITVYPNPMSERSTLMIHTPVEGNASISIYDITGRTIAIVNSYFDNSPQEFSLSGFRKGIYIINVRGNNFRLSEKFLSNHGSEGGASFEKIGSNITSIKKASGMKPKGTMATVDMQFTTGDRLKFKGISDIYSTILTDIPDADKTITFNFHACTDGDDNNYPVVEIGSQVWMAENLKTTTLNDGLTAISLMAWSSTPGYLWYNSDIAYKDPYGALYNWYAASLVNLCPDGWHVPSDTEWWTLVNYFHPLGYGSANKLKETGTSHWISSSESVTNESGFTALPGGWVVNANFFGSLGKDGNWWSSTELTSNYAYMFYMSQTSADVGFSDYDKRDGFSIRCLKD